MQLILDPNKIEDYRTFLRVKQLPAFRCRGRLVEFPDEYAAAVLGKAAAKPRNVAYSPAPFLFDYQAAIARLAIQKRKYATFIRCGFGKSLIYFEFGRHVLNATGKRFLVITPKRVVTQMAAEYSRFYGAPLDVLDSRTVQSWLDSKLPAIGVTNWETLKAISRRGNLAGLALDESSMLKSAYGKFGGMAIKLGRGLEWKIAGTGTPAPNDRIEFANHAVFLDRCPTVNSFYAKYFINRGQTQNRWEMKPHALKPFYRDLSDWCIFMNNPATYGWKDNVENLPAVHVHIHEVDMTPQQRDAVYKEFGTLYVGNPGGITQRGKLSRWAKGIGGMATHKYDYIRGLVDSWSDESTLMWCWFNPEQSRLEKEFPLAASVHGGTTQDAGDQLIAEFQAGRRKILLSKPKCLGFGLNLQVATRQIFSSLIDSYEMYQQAVSRSNRYGSTRDLNVHLPMTELEMPMVETVLAKARRVESDDREQEELFKECGYGF